MKTLYRDNKGLHRWLFACGAVLVLFYLFRGNRAAVNFWVYSVTLPFEQFLGRACAALSFSVAELLYVLAAVTAVVLLVLMVRYLIKSCQKGRAAYRCALFVLDLFLTVCAAFSLLWGANYYADDFCDRSGLSPEPVAYEDLVRVTQYFADHLAEASTHIMRDENGLFTADRQEILNYADTVYDCLYDEFPFLDMPDQKPKGIFFSKIMSAMNFTGFYFPFTGESNVNMDSPAMLLASTCAHELSHQRGITSEQQSNFLAVLACTRCDDANYNYAGWMLGYIHLGNALYRVDPDAWQQIRDSLPDEIVLDLRYNSAYWAQYKGLTATVTQSLNDKMIKSYGDELGTQSYGAVVDLLVNYYASAQLVSRYDFQNSLVRSCCGISNNCSGLPCSTMTPPSRNTTRSLTARAKGISCVTMTIVMCSSARERMTRSTSPVSSGSSAEVGSSKKRISGFIASARAMATRCCCPPES